jgi:proteasome lid subunit RPN8/RPN11
MSSSIDINSKMPRKSGDKGRRSDAVVICTDVLYQAYYQLFPAERMVIFAGRRTPRGVVVGAGFDVTGSASPAHVRADPARLARALIHCTKAGSHCALWAHSHPGCGPEATQPSQIDRRQEASWLSDSPSLVSIIVVRDRYIRVWGTPIDRKVVRVRIHGKGLEQIDESVFRLA